MIFVDQANADVKVDETSSTYELQGLSPDAIHEDLILKAPREGDEIIERETNDDLTWKFQTATAENSCGIVKDVVNLKISQRLPSWSDRERADPSVRTAWRDYFDNLRAHENGHKTISVKAAHQIDRLLHHASTPGGTCADLEVNLNRAAKQTMADAEREQGQWDDNDTPFDLSGRDDVE